MYTSAEAAIGAGDHALGPHGAGEAFDPLGDQLGVLDHVGGVADDARHDQLAVGQFDVVPERPLAWPRVMRWRS